MVLGMVPFTALALPAGETAGQVTDAQLILDGGSTPLAGWKVSACVLKSDVQARTASESLTTTVHAEFTLPIELSNVGYQIQIGNGTFALTVSTDDVGKITDFTPTSATYGDINFTIAADNTKLEVTADGVSLGDGYGLKDVQINVHSGGSWYCSTMQVTVPAKASIDAVSAYPTAPEVGEEFTVTVKTDAAESGTVAITYDGATQYASILSAGSGKGVAQAKFTATENRSVSAQLLSVGGSTPMSDSTKSLTLGALTTYRTITFLPGAADAYIPFSPTTVSVEAGGSYTIPTAIPTREGYTFKGWNDGTTTYNYTTGTFAPAAVPVGATDVILNAVWEETKYTINYSADTSTAAKYVLKTLSAAIGETVYFSIKVPDGYDASTMTVAAESTIILAPYSSFSGTNDTTYYYSFVLTQNMASGGSVNVSFTDPSKLSYTVTMPVGDNFTAEFTDHATSKTVTHGDDYSFVVTPDAGYNIKGVYVNGVKQTADSNGVYIITNVTGPQTIEVSVDEIPVYTVTYVVNNAQFTTQKVSEGAQITTLPENPVIDGYTFGGWFTKQDGAGTAVMTDTVVNGDMTVYAGLTAETYTVTYDENGGDTGTAPTDQTKTHGVALNLSTDVPTRTGYKFLGWGTDADATVVSYQPGQTYSADADLALYAVWEQLTFTVTLPSGTGFTVNALGSTTVKYGEDFTFEVIVDRAYAKTAPVVEVNGNPLDGTGATSNDSSATWTYTITNITEDKQVAISVTMNPTHVVTFVTWLTDVDTTTLYMTQKVENGYPAAQPAAPVVEGYTFGGWVWDDPATAETTLVDYSFATLVNTPVTIVAKMLPIKPVVTIPANGTGWSIEFTETDGGATGTNRTHTHAYNADCTFTVTIGKGWDASKMAVGANGLALAPVSIEEKSDKTVVYTYNLVNITANTNITVVGVVRKTVTVTYMPNAKDDVSGWTGGQEQINYFIVAADDGKITSKVPSRTGYTFLGWSLDADRDPDQFNSVTNAARDFVAGEVAGFTTDTTLYAIWQAVSTTITLEVSDVAKTTGSGTATDPYVYYEYEGQEVTLTATLNTAVSTGSVIFYQNDQVISSQNANSGTTYTFKATTGAYAGTDTYKVAYKAESDEGYDGSESDPVSVTRLSTAITWKLDGDSVENTAPAGTGPAYYYASTLTITPDGGSALAPGVAMTADKTYTLTAPAVYELGTTTALTVGTDYVITWQYLDGANGWKTLAENQTTSTFQVTSKYSKYQFRALMVVNTGDSTVYTKAAKFADEYYGTRETETMNWLISEPTPAVALQQTKTTLAITGAVEEAANQVLFGATKFGWGNHLVQYENQTVTLKATVTDNATDLGVNSVGKVYFYRYTNDGVDNNDVLLNANGQGIEVGPDGIATMNYTMPDYDSTKAASDEENCSRIYAVYVEGVTYDTSASVSFTTDAYGEKIYGKPNNGLKNMVFSMSTTIQTPIIDSEKGGVLWDATTNTTTNTSAFSTTYDCNLKELLAGVEHTFTLRTGNAAADWSVVALDGRTVAAENYDIQWLVTTGSNEEQAPNDATQASFVVNESKNGDKYRVKLIHKGDMTADAFSNYVVINSLQNVTVEVTASDEIDSTPGVTDVYQLNPITLTATVAAAQGANATMQPSGTVAFYYQDGTSWVYLGEDVLDVDTDGQMRASIDTTKLPVTAGTNVKRDVEITAVYLGDNTFNVSRNYNETTREVSAGTTTNGVTDETVTVYSSVVYVGTNENKATGTVTDGINISANGALKANNADVTLTLSDIYTLDHAIDLSKLAFDTDYTVQWWKLDNANACKDPGTTDSYALTSEWEKINGATNINYTIDMVPQNVAYRAEITVKETPIAKGSYTFVDQGIVGTADIKDGRRVYYSNVLVVGDGMLTVTTNITTSDNKEFNEEGIVKGETVTIHTLVAGATGSAPVCNVVATVEPKGNTDPTKIVTITADGGSYTSNGYCALTWNTAAEDVTPGYYTLKVTATSNNGYESQDITRELIVRDNQYTLTVTDDSKVYNGKAQGIDWTLTGIDFENALAQDSVVVYYYQNGKMVEPTQAGNYTYELYLPASAYWTELTHVTGTFTIEQRPVSIADAVIQTKVYNGRDNVNVLEVMLGDAVTNSTTGLPSDDTGVIHGDSIYATATAALTSGYTAGTQTVTVTGDQELHGDDAHNYKWATDTRTYTEKINVQRSQVKGDIADATYAYGTTKVPADDIILIDQEGTKITEYEVIYYYHNGDGVEKVPAMNWKGKYTVIARPADQVNYKGGASQVVYVADAAIDAAPIAPTSTLINISNTVDLYGEVTGIDASATNGATITKVEYAVNGTFTTVADLSTLNVGRYLVKVTASTGDTAYGIYTIVKARPELTLTADNATYTSAPYAGAVNGTYNGSTFPTGTYFTYTGGTIQCIAYEAPIDAGDYVVTAHVPADGNYTAHEVSANFTIAKAKLTIDADELVRMQYESYPDMVATFKGLVGSTEAPDTSLRDVQIQPEFIFNEKNGGYTNAALDQVGADYPITVRNALSRNYEITYVGGSMVVNAQDANADLAIHGMIDNGSSTENVAYYGDVIQLYAYGNYGKAVTGAGDRHNTSCLINWSLSSGAPATIDSQDGLLTITGVGTFTVTLTRGTGTAAISTSIEIKALPKEVKVDVADQDKVYNGNSQDYNGAVTVKGLINGDTDAAILVAGGSRGPVGSQVVTYQVNTTKYQSEIYGGLFTINHKEVTVKPDTQTVDYGADLSIAENAYTVTGEVGSPLVSALNTGSTVVASVRELYNNLDVLDGYEILVAGTENINYNVTYLTKTDAGAEQPEDVKVTAKNLTFKTGVINSDGRTSGYMKSNSLFYKDEGFAITGETFTTTPVDRMYGEVNPVMDYLFDALIAGDSEADLANLLDWLVEYDYNINADANVKFDKNQHLNGYRATAAAEFISGTVSNYVIETDLDADDVVNYNTNNIVKATQNIYQRPVTLTPRVALTAYKPSIINSDDSVNTTVLKQLLLNNLVVGEYSTGKGGLATLLGHTIEDLDIQIVTATYNGTDTITVTIKLGNTNYWTENVNFTVNVDPTKIWVDYGTLGKTSASVTMYMMDANGVKTGVTDVTGTVHYLIYAYDANDNGAGYSYYKNLSPVRDVEMAKRAGVTGVYDATYAALPAGRYVMFAIASNYTIIE